MKCFVISSKHNTKYKSHMPNGQSNFCRAENPFQKPPKTNDKLEKNYIHSCVWETVLFSFIYKELLKTNWKPPQTIKWKNQQGAWIVSSQKNKSRLLVSVKTMLNTLTIKWQTKRAGAHVSCGRSPNFRNVFWKQSPTSAWRFMHTEEHHHGL